MILGNRQECQDGQTTIASFPLPDRDALERADEDAVSVQPDVGPGGIFRGNLATVEGLEGFGRRFKENQFSLLVESEHAVTFLDHGPVFSELFVGGPFGFAVGEVNTVEFLVATVQVDVPVDEGGVETHKWLNPADDGEGDRFSNQRKACGQTGEKVVLGVRMIAEFAIDELDHATCRSIVEMPRSPGTKAHQAGAENEDRGNSPSLRTRTKSLE